MSVVLLGSTSGSVTLQEPAVAGSTTINLPATSGTMAVLPTATSVLPEASGGTGTTTGYYGFKNRLINGGMVIDQRNAGASVTNVLSPTVFAYCVDRWGYWASQASKFTMQQSSIAPAGYTTSLKITSSSAFTVASADYFTIGQCIEGFNVADLGYGAAGAATVTLSFWVRSSLTGTFSGCIQNGNVDRSYPFTYTISAANTWEQKSVTIAGDTTGTWNTLNNAGLYVLFSLGVGSDRQGTANIWNSANDRAVAGETPVVGTSGATFYITGVQLEKGTQATGFEYRQYGQELALCQRYYYRIRGSETGAGGDGMYANGFSQTTTVGRALIQFPVTMRTFPSA